MKRILSLVLVLAANFVLMSCHQDQEQHRYPKVNQKVKGTWPDSSVDIPAYSVSTLLERCEKEKEIAETQVKLMKSQMPKCRNSSEAAKALWFFQKLELTTGTYFLSNSRENWHTATKRCVNAGMTLVSIESQEETDAIREVLPANVYFWSSGSDLGSEGHFFWASTGKSFEFVNWSHLDPNNVGGNENCVAVVKAETYLTSLIWIDDKCEKRHKYLCELRTC